MEKNKRKKEGKSDKLMSVYSFQVRMGEVRSVVISVFIFQDI